MTFVPAVVAGIKMDEMLWNAIRQAGSIAPAQDGRFVVSVP